MRDRFIKVKEKDELKIQELGYSSDMVWQEYTTVDEILDKLNEQDRVINHWAKSSSKITNLLQEAVKPTAKSRYDNPIFLSIDLETKRCKYEKTVICNNCDYFSTYFLDCRFMMEDKQYKKAVELGLVKE